VYNALCQHFLKARAPDQGLEPFLSPSKIVKKLEHSSPGFDPPLLHGQRNTYKRGNCDTTDMFISRNPLYLSNKKKQIVGIVSVLQQLKLTYIIISDLSRNNNTLKLEERAKDANDSHCAGWNGNLALILGTVDRSSSFSPFSQKRRFPRNFQSLRAAACAFSTPSFGIAGRSTWPSCTPRTT
jgi:hypothetical protein